jgi:hypothetical protein
VSGPDLPASGHHCATHKEHEEHKLSYIAQTDGEDVEHRWLSPSAEQTWQEFAQELANVAVKYPPLVRPAAIRADVCLIRDEGLDPEATQTTIEDDEAAVDVDAERGREQRWDTVVRMCMEASTPLARKEWLKDQRDQERQEECQRLANLHQPSDVRELKLGRGGDARADDASGVWQDYSSNKYVE